MVSLLDIVLGGGRPLSHLTLVYRLNVKANLQP